MIRILFLLVISFSALGQSDTTKYFKSVDYGWRYQRIYTPLVFAPPQDTTYGKWGIAQKGSSLFVGNGTRWTVVGGSSIDTNRLVKYTDTLTTIATKTNINGLATTSSVNSALGLKVNIADTLNMLNGRLSSITLNATGAIHNTPITFSRLGGAWSGNMSLANQSPFTVFRRASGTGTPSFSDIDSNYFGGRFATQVRAAALTTGTYAQRIALTPTVGQQFYQTNENEGMYVSNGVTWEKIGSSLLFQEEFIANYSTQTSLTIPYLVGNTSGTGANFSTPTGVSNNYSYGLIQLNTGTTTTGLSRIYYNFIGTSNVHYANSITYTEYLILIPTLSDGTNTYVLKVGDESNVAQVTSSNNTQFRYTHSENSGAWSVQYRTNGGTGTNVNTGVTVAANTWYRLGIKRIFPSDMINGTLTIEFYINGTLTNSVAASPVWYLGASPFIGIYKTAGATSASVILDYFKHYKIR